MCVSSCSHYYVIVTNNKVNSITNNTHLYPYDNDKWRPFGYYIAAVHNATNDNTILIVGDNSTTIHNKQKYLNGPLEEGHRYRIMIRLFSATKKVILLLYSCVTIVNSVIYAIGV